MQVAQHEPEPTPSERRSQALTLAVVIPIFNEVDAIPELVMRLSTVFAAERLREAGIAEARFLFVDDGSSDGSTQSLLGLARGRLTGTVVQLSRNFGHQAAISAGLEQCHDADVTAIIDADLQDPPEIILAMIERWREGFDVVYGKRRNRKEQSVRVGLTWLFYRALNLLTPIDVPADSGDFCLVGQRVVRSLDRLPERLRFTRGLRTWVGFRQTGISYDRPARVSGSSKYSMAQLYRLATDGIASLSVRPLQLAQVFSFTYFVGSLLALLWLALTTTPGPAGGAFELRVLLILFLLSNAVVMFYLYILGAYIGRTYLEVKGRPTHIIDRVVDIDGSGTCHD